MAASDAHYVCVFNHATLRHIIGLVRGEDVVQFRGIRYADIPGRFRQPVIRTSLPVRPYDATSPGPTCPQWTGPSTPQFWDGPLASDTIPFEPPLPDEYNCLNLNITVPKAVLDGHHAAAPVLIYIHGGAFLVGSASVQVSGRELWDPTRWVRHSVTTGRPLVIVTINYRVGALGFLASERLAAFNRAHDEAVGNYGLHDQRQALQWVSNFIGGFGGDADEVTVMGGSAGGVSAHFQALFRGAKVKRAIPSSGTAFSLGAMPFDYHQRIFDQYAEKYKGDDAVAELQSVPVDELVANMFVQSWRPVVDTDWIPGRTLAAYAERSGAQRPLPDLLVGSCAYEDDIILAMLIDPATGAFQNDAFIKYATSEVVSTSGITTNVSDLLSTEVLKLYGIVDTVETPSKDIPGWAHFLADIMFRIPPYLVAQHHQTSKIFVYEFQATSPFHGWPLGYEKAHHACSDLSAFDVAGDLVEEKHRAEYEEAVEQVRDLFGRFCYGELQQADTGPGGESTLGSLHTIANGDGGKEHKRLVDVVGAETESRWKAVLKVVEA